MFSWFNRLWSDQVGLFAQVRGNARPMMLTLPLFNIPWVMVAAYVTLYMQALGLKPWEIGLVTSVGSASSMVFAFFGGYITDRMGRRRTNYIFSLLGWSLPTVIWAVAQNVWFFLIAAILTGVGAVVNAAWSCLLVEDTPPDERLPIFTLSQLNGVLAGLFVPLAGMAVGKWGLVSANRLMYVFFLVCETVMFILCNAYICEPRIGLERMQTTKQHSWHEVWVDYKKIVISLLGNRVASMLFLLSVLLAFRDTLIVTFSSIYINGVLRIPAQEVAVFPTVSAVVQLLALVFGLKWLRQLSEQASLKIGVSLSLVSLVLFVFSPPNGLIVLVLSTCVGAIGGVVLGPSLNTAWNNALPDAERAKLTSVFFLLIAFARLPAGGIAGILYDIKPELPFVTAIGMTVLCFVLLIRRTSIRSPVKRM